jgi:hypothetical protein
VKIEQFMDRLRRSVVVRRARGDRGASWAGLLPEAS